MTASNERFVACAQQVSVGHLRRLRGHNILRKNFDENAGKCTSSRVLTLSWSGAAGGDMLKSDAAVTCCTVVVTVDVFNAGCPTRGIIFNCCLHPGCILLPPKLLLLAVVVVHLLLEAIERGFLGCTADFRAGDPVLNRAFLKGGILCLFALLALVDKMQLPAFVRLPFSLLGWFD